MMSKNRVSKRVRVLDSTKEQYRLLSLPVLLPPFCFSRCHLSHNTLPITMKHSTILLPSVLGGYLLLGLLLPRHGEAVMAPCRRRLTRSAFDGRRMRRRGTAASTTSTSVGSFRGGAAAAVVVDPPPPADTEDILPPLARIALGAAVQTGLSYALAMNLVSLGTILRASALLVIAFGSSYFGSIVDMMGSSAATRQVLDPNRVPVSNVRGRFRYSSSSLLILLGHPLYLLSLGRCGLVRGSQEA